ncbi:MAG: biotin/lipoyl-binding protein, partial [Patescibacteria group bacterium]
MKKKLIITVSILVIVIGGYLAFRGIFGQKDSNYTKIPVARGEVAEIVSVTGTVIPAKEIDLQFESAGKISRIENKVGDKVLTGQVLVRLEAGELNAQLQSYQAALDKAEAKLSQTLAGARSEDIQVYQAAVDSAQVTAAGKEQALIDAQKDTDNDLKEAYEDALDILKTSYTKADQALLIVFKGVRESYFYDSSQLTFSVKEKENIAKDD